MLDTNILSDMIRNPSGMAATRLRQVGDASVCTSIVVASELRYGAEKKGSEKLTARVEAALREVEILALDVPADTHYGLVRSRLEAEGRTIGQNDLLIAAHALSLGLTLVTANVQEFNRIDGLRIENWLEG
ncbi:type II toxin-antitoxin system VapC family toxin [Microvirga aerilata]|uniref:Ribonuclease VapC n=1 Tax=Microvirga aerilata TaxID=670292 RepID=A0A936ZC64_9HYPH|nr:type II toxin-antitoxin system VapC family toxin [Microvirga aerilata]MBL0407407.1 type II toxin-antitoxin system VapC family toxin [Microvirga aerilata]